MSADGTPFFPFSVEQKSHNFGLKCFSVPIVGSIAISELNPRSTKLYQTFKYFSKDIFIFSNTMAWKGKIANSARIQALSSHSICDTVREWLLHFTDLQTCGQAPEPSFSMLRYKQYIFWKLMTANAMNLIQNISQSFLKCITEWIYEVQEILNCKSFSEDRCKEQVWTTIYNSFTICKRECHIYYFTIKLWILSIHPSNIVVIDQVSKTMQEKKWYKLHFFEAVIKS